MRAGEFRLLGRADRADHRGAEMLGPLRGDEPDAAGGGVEQDGVAGLHPVGPPQQVLRGEALEHHCGCGLVGDGVGQVDHTLGVDHDLLGIGAGGAGIGDALADTEIGDALTERIDHARALLAEGEGERGRLVSAGAEIDVDEVDTDGGLADADLARTRLRRGHVLVGHRLGPAILVHPDRLGHRVLPLGPESIGSKARYRAAGS